MENKKGIVAIMGPSGAGKTTLGNNLVERNGLIIPKYTTTRNKRNDDKDGFYRYLDHIEYNKKYNNGEFLISSGDSKIISKENGNFYGVLLLDCFKAWELYNQIILYTSYKDIMQIVDLNLKIDIKILNLTFKNLVYGIRERMENDPIRNHSEEDIEKRIFSALSDRSQYWNMIQLYADGTIFTDEKTIQETYEEACDVLKLIKN